MRGSKIAKYIENDMRRDNYWKNKVVRRKCYIDKQKQCDKCAYRNICEVAESKTNEE